MNAAICALSLVLCGQVSYETLPPVGPMLPGNYPLIQSTPGYPTLSEAAAPVVLYDCVKYRDLKNVHPCGIPMIVAVKDPRECCTTPGVERCVFIQICVPPEGCPKISTHRRGKVVEYDFGKYEIDIVSKDGVVSVDYDD